MAQSGFTPISIYYSATATNVPTAGNLVAGELAINTADGKLFYKDSAGVVQVIGTKGGVGSSTTTQVLYNSSGLVVGSANFTYDGTKLSVVGAEAFRAVNDIAYLSFYNSANSTRSGYLQLQSGGVSTLSVDVAQPLSFQTSGTERMRIASGGNVLIGSTTDNGFKFKVVGGNASNALIDNDGSRYTQLVLQRNSTGNTGGDLLIDGTNATMSMRMLAVGALTFNTSSSAGDGVERMRIDSSGNVGIGTSSPAYKLDIRTTGSTLNRPTAGSGTGQVDWHVTNTGGDVYFGMDGSAGAITGTAYGAYVYNSANTPLTFTTNVTERMRITSAGNVSIGTTSSGGKLTVNDGNINVNWGGGFFTSLDRGITVLAGGYNDTTNKARVVQIGGVGDNNNRCGWTSYSIKTNSVGNGAEYYIRPVTWTGSAFAEQTSAGVYLTDNATSWSSASDERLKDIIEPISDASNKVSTLRAVIGKYKTDEEGIRRTFLIAQDVQKVLPEAVNEQEDKDKTLGLKYVDVIPLLVAAIQEQKTMIENLTTRLNALEGK
jgi:hypothetical protein